MPMPLAFSSPPALAPWSPVPQILAWRCRLPASGAAPGCLCERQAMPGQKRLSCAKALFQVLAREALVFSRVLFCLTTSCFCTCPGTCPGVEQ